MSEFKKVPMLLMRGGTSKGAYLLTDDLPSDPQARDKVILDLYGSPDIRQINGIGGADPLTSKVVLVTKSQRSDADVDYTVGYVGIDKGVVDYAGNCGNMSSAVAPFAILRGLVKATAPLTTVRLFNGNTNKIIEAQIPCTENGVQFLGDYAIDGVPGTGAKIQLDFLNPQASKTKALLPTGNVQDTITLSDGKAISVSVVDAANPAIFVKAESLGLTGKELPSDTEKNPKILEMLEDVRTTGSVLMGLSDSKETAGPAVPKVCMVSPAQDYLTSTGHLMPKDEIDLVARTKSWATMHKAYAVTGGICTAVAALINGTVVNEVVSDKAKQTGSVTLGHPSGQLEFQVKLDESDPDKVERVGVMRTAKPIVDGQAFILSSLFES